MTLAGLRPGEKLFEEKLMAEEGLKKTKNKLIHIGCPIPFNTEQFLQQLTVLMKAAYDNDQNIREMVELIVPTYLGVTSIDVESKDQRKQFWKDLIRSFSLEDEICTVFGEDEANYMYEETIKEAGYQVHYDGFCESHEKSINVFFDSTLLKKFGKCFSFFS